MCSLTLALSTGLIFQCTREDRILIPRETCLSLLHLLGMDLNACYQSRLCAISTLGVGRAGLIKKLSNCLHNVRMEAPPQRQLLWRAVGR